MGRSQRPKLVFNAAGVTPPADVSGMPWNAVYLEGTGVVSAGVVTVQICHRESFADIPEAAWITTAVTLSASSASAGAQVMAQLPIGAYSLVRLKVTTPLSGGGTIVGYLVSNG